MILPPKAPRKITRFVRHGHAREDGVVGQVRPDRAVAGEAVAGARDAAAKRPPRDPGR